MELLQRLNMKVPRRCLMQRLLLLRYLLMMMLFLNRVMCCFALIQRLALTKMREAKEQSTNYY